MSWKNPIKSSDSDALERITGEIADCEALQERMKKCNAACRKNDLETLNEMGYSATQIQEFLNPEYSFHGLGYPKYELDNNRGNITRLKKRLESLKDVQAIEYSETELTGGVRIIQNVDEFRTQIDFGYKPDGDIRARIKSYGFKYAPSTQLWQRQLSLSAFRCAVEGLSHHGIVVEQPEGQETPAPAVTDDTMYASDENVARPDLVTTWKAVDPTDTDFVEDMTNMTGEEYDQEAVDIHNDAAYSPYANAQAELDRLELERAEGEGMIERDIPPRRSLYTSPEGVPSLDVGTVEEFEEAARDGRPISISGFMNTVVDEVRAAPPLRRSYETQQADMSCFEPSDCDNGL